ncbi:MAG: DUF4906 domain-containing protein [Bacteroidetes bacterium]|uniref:DUF4906 domain-containing protein n=1 Tax=Candidatus Cryptobacteroides faecigallinarum TaxID=2840763 RepID=A0A9D9IM66_9BACT|nr:DUF4906 domain-containing protein [Candidatus Cryptobacteroides faecigallinarum]
MRRSTGIRSAVRLIYTETAKVLGAAAAVLLLITVSGCRKENVVADIPVFGGPTDVMLVLSDNGKTQKKTPDTKAVIVDEIQTIHSIKIYAFKHGLEELAGFVDYPDVEADQRNFHMHLNASGQIDFYVIANDIFADTGNVLDEKSRRKEIENTRFSGLKSTGNMTAVPMSNMHTKKNGDGNFTFTIEEDNDLPPIIPIELTRAMARLSFSFAKSADDDKIFINSITIQNEPESAGYFTSDGSPYGLNQQEETIVSNQTEITVLNTTGSVEGDMQDLADEDYLLPNDVGVSNSAGLYEGNAKNAYLVTVDYSVNGVGKTKEIYLPPVRPNDWVQIKAIFKEDINNCVFHIIAVPWERKVMDDIIFD